MDIYGKMKELGLALPQAPARGGMYASCKAFGKGLYYVSGCGPVIGEPIEGRLGREFGIGEGKQYARDCMLNVLAILEAAVGDLRKR